MLQSKSSFALRTSPRLLPAFASRRSVVVRASAEYDALKGAVVFKASSGDAVDLLDLWTALPGTKVVLPFMTHFADLSSWEYAQRLVKALPLLESSGVQVFAVGLGSVSNAQEFAATLNFPTSKLFADPDGSAYSALGFSVGFDVPGMELPAAAKLTAMLAGIGSPGTIQEVLRGYVGDKEAKPVFDSPTPFDILGTGYQRPFELATQRLFNMVGILPKWGELSPPNERLLTQQGGTVAFDGTQVIFKHSDSGILKYTDVDELTRVVLGADYTSSPDNLSMRTIDIPTSGPTL